MSPPSLLQLTPAKSSRRNLNLQVNESLSTRNRTTDTRAHTNVRTQTHQPTTKFVFMLNG